MALSVKRVVITSTSLIVLAASANAVVCPDGWYETSGRCFRVFDFGQNEKQSWEAAMATCAAHGTPLATIHRAEEESLISSLSARYDGECWTGLRKYRRFKPDKGWLWIDRDEALSESVYLNWGSEWKSVWKVLPPDEKCGTVKADGWGNRPCWGPGSKLECFVCGTMDPDASDQAKDAFRQDFTTDNWWVPPPESPASPVNDVGNSKDGWNIGALDTGDSVSIEDPNTFWGDGSENGGIDPSLLRTTPAPTTTTTTRLTTLPPMTTTDLTTTTTPKPTTTTPKPTTTRPTTTTTTRPPTTTTTKPPTTTTRPTTTTLAPTTTTTLPPTTTTLPPTTTTLPPTTTTRPPTTTTEAPTRSTTTTRTEREATRNTDERLDANGSGEDAPQFTESEENNIVTGLAIAVGSVAAIVATSAGVVAYRRNRSRQLGSSIASSPETQSFTDVEG